MSEKLPQRRLIQACLFVFVVLMIAGLYAFFAAQRQPNRPIAKPLVGTWRTSDEDGDGRYSILDFREDGTARWRLSTGEELGSAGNTIGYLEWWTGDEPNQIVTHQYSSKNAAIRSRISTAIFGGLAGGRGGMELVEASDSEVKLRTPEGKDFSYHRTEDQTLRDAP